VCAIPELTTKQKSVSVRAWKQQWRYCTRNERERKTGRWR